MNRSCLSLLCCFSHTVQSLGHAFPALCREHVWLRDVLLHLRPSLPNLRRSFYFLVGWFTGTTAQSDFSNTYMSALRLAAFADRPSSVGEGVLEISRFSCMLFYQRARVLRLRRTGQPLACNAAAVLPSSTTEGSQHPDLPAFRSSIARPTNGRDRARARPPFRWRVTSLALSVARWVQNSTMATFPEAPL